MYITKIVTFDAGHRLSNYEGKCKSLHGHTYTLEVTVGGKINQKGMVIDFGDLKKILKDEIDSKFDHKTVLFKKDLINQNIARSIPLGENWIAWVDYNPTAENIASDIFNILKANLKDSKAQIIKVKLWETPTSFAEIQEG